MLEQIDWLQTELDELTSSPEASLVRTSASQDPEPACPVSAAACGPNYSELSLKFDPLGQSLRMSLGLELSELTQCSLTWQEQATPLGRWWWVLSMPELHTDDSVFGLLRTPLQSDAEKQGHGNLSHQIKTLLPTPQAYSHGESNPPPSATTYGRNKGGQNPDGKERPSLETMAKDGMLPTPTARDVRTGGDKQRDGGPSLSATVNGTGTGRLSPCFVEVMMGYPVGWTEVE